MVFEDVHIQIPKAWECLVSKETVPSIGEIITGAPNQEEGCGITRILRGGRKKVRVEDVMREVESQARRSEQYQEAERHDSPRACRRHHACTLTLVL